MFKVVLLALVSCVTLAGCAASMTPDQRYVPGQNYGASDPSTNYPVIGNPTAGEVKCNSRQTVDGYVPFCPIPNDGDEWTNIDLAHPITY